MSLLTLIMAITLGIIAVVSVMAIVMSTSQGADWSAAVWKAMTQRKPGPDDLS